MARFQISALASRITNSKNNVIYQKANNANSKILRKTLPSLNQHLTIKHCRAFIASNRATRSLSLSQTSSLVPFCNPHSNGIKMQKFMFIFPKTSKIPTNSQINSFKDWLLANGYTLDWTKWSTLGDRRRSVLRFLLTSTTYHRRPAGWPAGWWNVSFIVYQGIATPRWSSSFWGILAFCV